MWSGRHELCCHCSSKDLLEQTVLRSIMDAPHGAVHEMSNFILQKKKTKKKTASHKCLVMPKMFDDRNSLSSVHKDALNESGAA